jgi:thymidylate synthase
MRSATNEWLVAISEVVSKGIPVAPRGKPCIELRGFQTVTDMNHPVMCVKERKLGYKFMAAEAAWILSGDYRVKSIAKYAKAITQFSDDGETFYGAYGPKIRGQLRHVIEALSGDTSTRQAVINIWRENPPKTKDVPCTISLQFLVRDGVLHVIDTMRSSDLWLGWPYDVFNMSMIARYVRSCVHYKTGIKYDLGALHLTAGSAHIYEENINACASIAGEWTEHNAPDLSIYNDSDRDALINHLWEAADNDLFKAKS